MHAGIVTYSHSSIRSRHAKSDCVHLCCVAWKCLMAACNGANQDIVEICCAMPSLILLYLMTRGYRRACETCLDQPPTAHRGPRQLSVCLPCWVTAAEWRLNQFTGMTLTTERALTVVWILNIVPRCRPILSASKHRAKSFIVLFGLLSPYTLTLGKWTILGCVSSLREGQSCIGPLREPKV